VWIPLAARFAGPKRSKGGAVWGATHSKTLNNTVLTAPRTLSRRRAIGTHA
jgi:hypothetical protein